jgi:hypothetical protein
MFTTRHGRMFLGIALFLALLGLLEVAVDGLLCLDRSGPFVLFALALLAKTAASVAKRRGWGVEGRITRLLSRPRFVDESRRSN